MNDKSLLARRYRVLGRYSPLFYDRPLHIERGSGVWVYDSDGRRYLDAYNNVPHVGHCHPRVVEAIAGQAAKLNTHTRYLHENIVNYAERLTSKLDASLGMAIFCCSGSEANELALRIARQHTGGAGVIVTAFTYHGNTAAVIELGTAFPFQGERSKNVRTISVLDTYRDTDRATPDELAQKYAQEVQMQIEGFKADGIGFAGLLVCTAFSSEGLPNVPPGFMQKAVQHVHAAGGLFIADEVQAGFGRLGTHMWGHQRLGAVPDIVTLGKPMGNGHPLAGVVSRAELIEEFASRSMYFNTFGGNPVSCAAGLAVLEVLEEERLIENAQAVGTYLRGNLNGLMRSHALIGEVRGAGLFCAVELVTDRVRKTPAAAATKRVLNLMRENGVLVSRTGPHDNVLKIRPPLPFSRENANQLLDSLDQALREVESH